MWNLLQQKITWYASADQELIRKAYDLAESSHKGQLRASGDPYISHPVAVATTLISLKLDAIAVAAGILHDVLEDTEVTKKELEATMGKEVTFLVESLTKLDRIRYRGFERSVESTRKMFLAVAEDVRVVLIKLADRLHNMHTIRALRPEKQRRIAQETLELYAPLSYRLGMGELKGELEDLAFPVVLAEEHDWLTKEIKKFLPQRRGYLEETVAPIIAEELNKGGVRNAHIDFRIKHLYSLWKKLLRYDLDLARITDLVALRIIVESTEDCYQALGIIHTLWPPIPGKIKDYIAMPKPNGYQSLHTTVICEDNVVTEFQIRTHAMHEEAEYGVTAHVLYDEAGKPKEGAFLDAKKIHWVKKLSAWQKDFASEDTEEFIEALKIDFFKDRIFVLTPKGEVIDLPEGSTPIDFAYHIHSEIGDHMAGAKVNGKMVAFSYALASGDTVEIITQKNKKPAPDWLAMACTSTAREHIRSSLRKQGIEPLKPQRSKREREVTLELFRKSRVGLLKDIVAVLAKAKINIIKTDADASDVNKPYLIMKCRIPRGCDFERTLLRLRRIKGVKEIAVKE